MISKKDMTLLNPGYALRAAGETEQALEAFSRVTQLTNNRYCVADAHTAMGQIYESDLGDLEAAEKQYRLVLGLYPSVKSASFFLFNLLADQGRLEEALAEGQRFFGVCDPKRQDKLLTEYRRYVEDLGRIDENEFEELRLACIEEAKRESLLEDGPSP